MHTAAMDSRCSERLKKSRLHAGFRDATAAARHFGWVVPTYLAHENGSRGFGVMQARRYADAFKTDASWLLTGQGSPTSTIKITISGYVGVGGIVYVVPEDDKIADAENIELPAGMYDDYLVFKVRGDANYPVYRDNEILLVRKAGAKLPAALNRECIVRTVDGRTLLRTLSPGSGENLFTLLSANAPPIADQAVEWAAPVEWTWRP